MSSPFQQRFSKKNPFGKNPKLNSVDTESSLPEAQFAGDDIESYDPKGAVVSERLKENYPEPVDDKKKTQVNSPLNSYRSGSGGMAYVSTAGHFQRLQDNIAQAFTTKEKNKDEKSVFKEFESKSDSLNKKPEVNLKGYDPSADYSGTFEDSKNGNSYNIGQGIDKSKNYFNRFGQ
jgi:ABC-type antimicrobial peptide transport system permease subunit